MYTGINSTWFVSVYVIGGSTTGQHTSQHNMRFPGRLVQPLLVGVHAVDGALFLGRNSATLKFQLTTIQHGPG